MDVDYDDEVGESHSKHSRHKKKKQPGSKLKHWPEWPPKSGEAQFGNRNRHDTVYLDTAPPSVPFGSPPRTAPVVTGSIANIRHERKTADSHPPTRPVSASPTLGRQSLVLLQCALDESMADTTFIVGFDDGDIREFRTIRALVGSTSPVLKKMLYTNPDAGPRNSDYVRLSSMTPRAFECIVQFASVTYPELNCYNVVDTLVAARIYDIGEGVLATLCETWIKKFIGPSTMCAVVNAAFALNAVDVLEYASHALKSIDCDECLRTDDFLLLCTPALHFILSSEDFAVDEEMLWTRCCEWAQTRFNIARDRFTQLIQDEHAMHQYHQAHLGQTVDDIQYSSDDERRLHRVKPNLAPIYEAPDEEGDEEGDATENVRTNDNRRSRDSVEEAKDEDDRTGGDTAVEENVEVVEVAPADGDSKEDQTAPVPGHISVRGAASPPLPSAENLQRESSEDDLKAEWQDYLRPLGHLFRYPVMRWAFFVDRVVPTRILHDSCIIEILIYFHDRTRKTTFKTHSRTKTRNHSSNSSNSSSNSSQNSPSTTTTYPKFRVGDHVRIKPGITPSCGWGSVSRGDIGVVTKVHGKSLVIDFPNHAQWSGVASEIERIHDYHTSRF